MREITQPGAVKYRMVRRIGGVEHLPTGGGPMQFLRATAVALPFVGLAVLVGVLSVLMGLAG